MSETKSKNRLKGGPQDDQAFRSFSKTSKLHMNEMTYLILIAFAAALLTGALALPVTMSRAVFAGHNTAHDAPVRLTSRVGF